MSLLSPWSEFRDSIAEHFSPTELDSLCFDLSMAGENFDGWQNAGIPRRVEILLYELHQAGRIDKLLQLLRRERPTGAWPTSAVELGPAPFADSVSLDDIERRYLTKLVASCRDLKPYMDFGEGGKSKYFVQLGKVNVRRHVTSVATRQLHEKLSRIQIGRAHV